MTSHRARAAAPTLLIAALTVAGLGAAQADPTDGLVEVGLGTPVPAIEVGSEATAPQQVAQARRRPGAPAPGTAPAPGDAPAGTTPQPGPPTAYPIPIDPTAVSPPPSSAFPQDFLPLPDRWRIVEGIGVNERWYDPYNQNTLKGDRPLMAGKDYFLSLNVISDTVLEPRSVPTPVAIQTGGRGSNDVFGDNNQFLFSQTVLASVSLIKGDTVFRPQDIELRVTPAFNFNYTSVEEDRVLYADPTKGDSRSETFASLQEAFLDYHIWDISERYDFQSVRAGIQPFTADFRGFLFQDVPVGMRFFGNFDDNRWQYNLGWFRRFEKDINSGLNDLGEELRKDDVFVANLYRQDFPVLGLTSQATVVHNRNRDDEQFDSNGFPARPAEAGIAELRKYDVTYFGLNMDGRIGPINLTTAGYFLTGENDNSMLSGKNNDVQAFFLAAEPSIDFDWVRLRLSGLYASGDDDPYDDTDEGFDAIFENPLFAGADTSYWIRQGVPLIGGGFVTLTDRNSVLPALRQSKTNGQSNFTNPGLTLLGAGADLDILPELRLSFNANYLRFNETATLEELRQQPDIDNEIGWDLSAAAIWRPFLNQNVVMRLSGAMLLPGDGFKDLYAATNNDDYYYSVLANFILTY